ncbi:hypothetical protein ACFVZR_07775 [Streptomyces sp. NPDC058316]|uniref:hypothetical protein n=1 Tax=unclassified Streptomyces TaxID=2593676 RepID=UPI0036E28B20
MPRHLDQLPPDITTMSRKIAALQRELRELRAAKRAAYTTVTNGKTTYASEDGWEIVMDPANNLPIIYFRDPNGAEMAALNATPGRPGFNLSSGPFGDDDATDWRWVTVAGRTPNGVTSNWVTARFQTSNVSRQIGGWLYLDPNYAQLGLVNTDTNINQLLQIANSIASISGARLTVSPPASSSPGALVAASASHTGTLLSLLRGGVTMATVSVSGDAAFAGQLTAQTLNIGSGSSGIGGDLTVAGSGSYGTDLAVGGVSQGRDAVAFQARSATTAAAAVETVALTQTGVVLKTGRAYRVQVRGLAQAATAAAGVRVRVRKTNTSGAIWLDTYTIATPAANTNVQYANQNVVTNTTGATITTDLVMTWVTASGGGNSLLNAGAGLYTAFEVSDIGAAADFAGAQPIT